MSNTQQKTDWEIKQSKNISRLRNITALWLASFALAAFGPKFIWDFNTLFTIFALLVSIGIGFLMVLANKNFLQGVDELQRKIQTDAMGITLGLGLILGSSYELLEDIKLITYEPEISHLMIMMCLIYLVSIILGQRKYQ